MLGQTGQRIRDNWIATQCGCRAIQHAQTKPSIRLGRHVSNLSDGFTARETSHRMYLYQAGPPPPCDAHVHSDITQLCWRPLGLEPFPKQPQAFLRRLVAGAAFL